MPEPEIPADVQAKINSPTTNWTADENWMHAKNQESPEARRQVLLTGGALSPDSVASANSDEMRDVNSRLAAACRIGDSEVVSPRKYNRHSLLHERSI